MMTITPAVRDRALLCTSIISFNPVRHCDRPHLRMERLRCTTDTTRQGRGQEAAAADLLCDKVQLGGSRVLLRSTEARSGNFTGLFRPSLSPTLTYTPAQAQSPTHSSH